jgi:arylformamidase
MILYDLSHVIHDGMFVYPGDPPPRVRRLSSIDDGAALTTSTVELPCHAGTHVDAPAHFLAGGRLLSDYTAEAFCGPAVVLDLASEANVTAAALRAQSIPAGRHVLLRTRNSARARSSVYDRDHAFIDLEAAEVLIASRPRSVGFDDYSVDAFDDGTLTVHRRFAVEGLLVYVALDLSIVAAGEYTFFGLPPRIEHVEAAPVRAVLWRP